MKQETGKASGGSDKEIIYSKALKAGKRIYYLDVKKNLKDDLFIAITESKKNFSEEGGNVTFEKHKIFLYKEDFDKFMGGMTEIIDYIRSVQKEELGYQDEQTTDNNLNTLSDNEDKTIKLDIQFE